MSQFSLALADSSGETANTEWEAGDLTPVSLAGALTGWETLKDAIQAVVHGTQERDQWGDSTLIGTALNTSGENQRGKKWSVLLRDNTTLLKSTRKIPTANLSLLPILNGKRSEDLDLTAGVGLALKNAIEGFARSNIGNNVTVLRIYYKD
jgi:hypothetical protein